MTSISILTASYNYAGYLPDALSSVAQQAGDLEHVVVDDGSSDESRDLLRRWRGISYLEQSNAGLAVTLNRALEASSGEWIGWLNADDFYLPGIVDVLTSTAEQIDVVFGDAIYVDAEGSLLRMGARHRFNQFTLRLYGPYLAPPAFFVRRSAMPARGWDESTIKLMDWDLYLQLAASGARFQYVPTNLGAYRLHSGQQSRSATPTAETDAVRERHGLSAPAWRWRLRRQMGGVAHAMLKAIDGGYRREAIAKAHIGSDMRWWKSANIAEEVSRLP